jgi:hypothetical protein
MLTLDVDRSLVRPLSAGLAQRTIYAGAGVVGRPTTQLSK